MTAELLAGFASSCSSVTDAPFDVYTADVTLATKTKRIESWPGTLPNGHITTCPLTGHVSGGRFNTVAQTRLSL